MACRAWLPIEFTRVANTGAGALGASIHGCPGVDIKLLPAAKAKMRNIVADTLFQQIMVWMVGVCLLPQIIDEIRVSVRPCPLAHAARIALEFVTDGHRLHPSG